MRMSLEIPKDDKYTELFKEEDFVKQVSVIPQVLPDLHKLEQYIMPIILAFLMTICLFALLIRCLCCRKHRLRRLPIYD